MYTFDQQMAFEDEQINEEMLKTPMHNQTGNDLKSSKLKQTTFLQDHKNKNSNNTRLQMQIGQNTNRRRVKNNKPTRPGNTCTARVLVCTVY